MIYMALLMDCHVESIDFVIAFPQDPIKTNIRGAFHDNFLGFSGSGFRRKLAHTKTQEDMDKASKHNG